MRALISVHDKRNLEHVARGLVELGAEIISTGGTYEALQGCGVPVRSVADVTGFPEVLEGRVKTLHPAIHAGILADRSRPPCRCMMTTRSRRSPHVSLRKNTGCSPRPSG